MNEHVLVAGRRRDEPVAFGRIEPLDGAFLHRLSPTSFQMMMKTPVRRLPACPPAQQTILRGQRHKPDFGGSSEAGTCTAILSARQHQPDGQNPIARKASLTNTAQP